MQVFHSFSHQKMVNKLLQFEIRHDHSLDDERKFPSVTARGALVKIRINLASTDNVLQPHNISVLPHDFQHIAKNYQSQSSLIRVENHVEELINVCDVNTTFYTWLKNISPAMNSFVGNLNRLGNPCKAAAALSSMPIALEID